MALPATKVRGGDEGHQQRRPHHQGHRHPVEVGLRLPEGRGRGHRLRLHARRRPPRDVQRGKPPGDDYLLKVDNPLVVPVDKKIRIITTANDVIHAFMVPAFGIKQDAIPGFVRDTWFRAEKTGDFYGQCAELCGKEHAYMPIHVKVLSAEPTTPPGSTARRRPWPRWPTTRPRSGRWTTLVARGEKVYAANCAACHQANGKGAGPIKPLDGAAVVLDADKAQADRRCCSTAQNNGAMPAWKQLSDTEIAAVITYTKNNWSNKTGQIVQPADVVAARK